MKKIDKIYQLRDGSGIFAPKFGQHRGFYRTVAYDS
jgi:hypothetical protein